MNPNSEKIKSLFDRAAENVAGERKKTFKLLPGEPHKGTLYKGFVSSVEIKTIENPKSENVGKDLLVIHVQVTDNGAYKGMEEIFNRVLHPVSLIEPTAEEFERRIRAKGKIVDDRTKAEEMTEWETKVVQHLEYTLRQFEFIGVDTSSKDEARILATAANAVGRPAAWKVYDPDGVKYQTRRAFLEDARQIFGTEKANEAPDLFQDLPDGKDLPL